MAPISISIIIPTLNAAEQLVAQVAALRSQTLFPDQVIVIDSGSTDGTAALARTLPVELITIEPDSFDHGGTRNLAAEHAHGDIIIYLTQDALPLNRETISHLVEAIAQENVVVAYGRQISAHDASPGEKYLRLANYPPYSAIRKAADIPALGIKTFQNSNVCASYQRSAFEALGRFPAPVVCNEDMLFAAKVIFKGYSVAYCAEAQVSHTHHLSPLEHFKRYFDIAASLDRQPQIKALGKTEEKGLEFVKGQLAYLRKERKLNILPFTMVNIVAKYMGYKAGSKHGSIPGGLKPFIGLNKQYWKKAAGIRKNPSIFETKL